MTSTNQKTIQKHQFNMYEKLADAYINGDISDDDIRDLGFAFEFCKLKKTLRIMLQIVVCQSYANDLFSKVKERANKINKQFELVQNDAYLNRLKSYADNMDTLLHNGTITEHEYSYALSYITEMNNYIMNYEVEKYDFLNIANKMEQAAIKREEMQDYIKSLSKYNFWMMVGESLQEIAKATRF